MESLGRMSEAWVPYLELLWGDDDICQMLALCQALC